MKKKEKRWTYFTFYVYTWVKKNKKKALKACVFRDQTGRNGNQEVFVVASRPIDDVYVGKKISILLQYQPQDGTEKNWGWFLGYRIEKKKEK